MYSLSKTPVSAASAQDIVAHHLGSSARVQSFTELTDGYFNAAYRVELADGLVFVLKVAPPADVRVLRYERDIMIIECYYRRYEMDKQETWARGQLDR